MGYLAYTDEALLELREYQASSLDPVSTGRSDLLESLTWFRTGSSTSVSESEKEVTSYEYVFESLPNQDDPRVVGRKTTTERESEAENGPGGSNDSRVSFQAYDAFGSTRWSIGPDGVLVLNTRDQDTGVLIERRVGASAVPTADQVSGWPTSGVAVAAADQLVSESVADIRGTKLSSVDPSGVRSRRGYFYGEVFGSSSGAEYIAQITVPPFSSAGGTILSGPVNVEWMTPEGRTIAVQDYEHLSGSIAIEPETDTLDVDAILAQLQSPSAFRLVGRAEQDFDVNWYTTAYREWYGDGAGEYYEYEYEYDGLGRSTKTVFPDGSLEAINSIDDVDTVNDYDVHDRPLKVQQGMDGGTLSTVLEYFYDTALDPGGEPDPIRQGVGQGLMTWVVAHVDGSTWRSTRNVYDWRDRQVLSVPSIETSSGIYPTWSASTIDGPVQAVIYDRLGRVVESATFDGVTDALVDDLIDGDATELAGYSNLNVSSRSRTYYSQAGSVYRTASAITPNSLDPEWLVSNAWYDEAGRTIAIAVPGAPVKKFQYDAIGRVVKSIETDGASIKDATPAGLEGELGSSLFSQIEMLGDGTERVLQETEFSYFDNNDPEGSRHQIGITGVRVREHTETGASIGNDAIATYSGSVYDYAGRAIASVNFGTNLASSGPSDSVFETGGAAPSLLTSVPDRGTYEHTRIISETRYNERGLVGSTIDPLGREARVRYDWLGRAYATIQNAEGTLDIDWDPTNEQWEVSNRSSTGNRDANRVATTVFDSNGNAIKQTAHLFDGTTESFQTTWFVYDRDLAGLSLLSADSTIANNHLYEIRYPDPGTGLPSAASQNTVRFAYNRLGEQLQLEDQNGAVRSYVYDAQGRVTHELVDLSGVTSQDYDVDASVLQHRTLYDAFGRVARVQSFDAATIGGSESLVNEVEYGYDEDTHDLIQLTQTNSDSISTTLNWIYDNSGYLDSGSNRKRLVSMTYPDGTSYEPRYGGVDSIDDYISRIGGYNFTEPGGSSTPLVEYAHIGMGTVAVADHRLGGYQMDRTVTPTGARRFGADTSADSGFYAGWDRYGRLASQSVVRDGATVSGGSPDRDQLFNEHYEWNRAGNLRLRRDERLTADAVNRDWDIRYDNLNRVKEARRGVIVNDEIADNNEADGSQTWALDELNNWTTTDFPEDSSADQIRAHNKANELTGYSTAGGDDVDLVYDDNGNLIKLTRDLAGDIGSDDIVVEYVYDAWNRLVRAIKSADTATASYSDAVHVEFEYNPLHWRVVKRINTDFATDTGSSPSFEEKRYRTYSPSWQMLEETVETDGTHAGAERRDTYFWGKRSTDEILSKRKLDLTGMGTTDPWWHYVTDHLFSVRAVINADKGNAVHERVEYDAYGRPSLWLMGDFNRDGAFDFYDISAGSNGYLASYGDGDPVADMNGDGSLDFFDQSTFLAMNGSQAYGRALTDANTLDGPDNTIGYAGYHWDEELGLWLSRHRSYNPELGRWLQRDPAGYVDGLNLYAYVMGNPFALVDPTGLIGDIPDIWGAIESAVDSFLFGDEASREEREAVGAPSVRISASTRESVESAGRTIQAVQDVAEAAVDTVMVPVATVGASMVPGVGEAMDGYDVVSPSSSIMDRVLGGGSLVLNAATAGVAPNAGGFRRAGTEVVEHADEFVDSARRAWDEIGELQTKVHGNSNSSMKLQHGYDIYNTQTGDVVKTGISGQSLNLNGTSPRANRQVNALNRAAGEDSLFAARIVFQADGRSAAKAAEAARAEYLREIGNSMREHKRP